MAGPHDVAEPFCDVAWRSISKHLGVLTTRRADQSKEKPGG